MLCFSPVSVVLVKRLLDSVPTGHRNNEAAVKVSAIWYSSRLLLVNANIWIPEICQGPLSLYFNCPPGLCMTIHRFANPRQLRQCLQMYTLWTLRGDERTGPKLILSKIWLTIIRVQTQLLLSDNDLWLCAWKPVSELKFRYLHSLCQRIHQCGTCVWVISDLEPPLYQLKWVH